MPRNLHKTRCQVPGCRNWAMRGHTHCRPHRAPSSNPNSDGNVGPRGAGAPAGNLTALRTGDHAHPLSPADLDQLVHDILRAPDRLPHHLNRTIRDIHRRTQEPVKTLLALEALLPTLASRVADDLFVAELDTFVARLPPANRDLFRVIIWSYTRLLIPVRKLALIRKVQRATARKTQPSPDPPDQDAPQSSQRAQREKQ